ncbi:MAG TPA: hypothetical protein VGF67_09000 [Ktedonobacteraceae bacterium]|jgi:hypothetical protein
MNESLLRAVVCPRDLWSNWHRKQVLNIQTIEPHSGKSSVALALFCLCETAQMRSILSPDPASLPGKTAGNATAWDPQRKQRRVSGREALESARQ